MSGHWPDIARLWAQVGAPLRPSDQDLGFVTETISAWTRERGAPQALILGVTPELYRLPWPAGTDVLAVDHTQAMIDAVWPGPREAALRAEWIDMPLEAGSRDIALCDGGIHLLAYPGGQGSLARKLAEVVAPGGLCVFRLFVPPAEREAPETVLADLLAGKVPNLNQLKLRLGMALQEDAARGVRLGDVWQALRRAAPDPALLAARLGWPLEHLLAVDTYRDSDNRYYFDGVEDVRRLFCEDPGGFTLQSTRTPDYGLGERCPTVVFRRV